MLLSVHLPKCGGFSFRHAIETAYGRDRIHYDYDDRPLDPTSPVRLDPHGVRRRGAARWPRPEDTDVVHGHLWAGKYDGMEATRATFMRDPLARTISHYFFWRNYPRSGHPLHDYLLDHDLTLVEFARLPDIAHCYEGVFFADVDLGSFDLVGDVSTYARDLARLGDLLGVRFEVANENRNPAPGYEEEKRSAMSDASTQRELRAALSDDIDYWRSHTSARGRRRLRWRKGT